MPDYHGSSNPFRRKGRAALVQGSDNPEFHTSESAAWQPPIDGSTSRLDGAGKSAGKVVKHVRVQSPPPSSPEDNDMPRGDEDHPKLAQGDEGRVLGYDPFEPALTDESSDDAEEEALPVSGAASAAAPRNPFSKTLATLEGTEAKELGSDASTINAGKPMMDVEAFKQLLMTGSSGPAAPAATSTVAAPSVLARFTDGSSTEASSVSRHSIFENLHDNHSGSPRTSQEISEEERKGIPNLKRSASERKKPAPPNSRHGKLINIQLKDEKPRPQSLYSPYTTNPSFPSLSTLSIPQSISSTTNHRSATDLNKPLPPAPSRTSHDSDRESIFDTEAAGKTPEPPSPTTSTRRRTAPAPPAARRHGNPVSDTSIPQLNSKRLSIMGAEGRSISAQDLPSLHTAKAPPPPPVRRPGSIRSVRTTSWSANPSAEPEQSSSMVSEPPAPPPVRVPSMRAGNRPASVVGVDVKRLSIVPPPPPPHRQRVSGRNSLDVPGVISGSGAGHGEDHSENGKVGESAQEHDILADITMLQREIDALRQHQGTS